MWTVCNCIPLILFLITCLCCWTLYKFIWGFFSPRSLCYGNVWTQQEADQSQQNHACELQTFGWCYYHILIQNSWIEIELSWASTGSGVLDLKHPSRTCSWTALPSAGQGAKFQNGEKHWKDGWPEPVRMRWRLLCSWSGLGFQKIF